MRHKIYKMPEDFTLVDVARWARYWGMSILRVFYNKQQEMHVSVMQPNDSEFRSKDD